MKYFPLPIPLILAFLACASCAHVAKHYDAPDSTPLRKASIQLGQDVSDAKAMAALTGKSLKEVKTSSDAEGAAIALLAPKVAELEQLGPPELRPKIDELKAQVEALDALHATTATDLADTQKNQAALETELEKANADDKEVKAREAEYLTKVDKLAVSANKSEQELATASKSLWWYRAHWWGAWLVAALGVALCVFLASLKATGRLALAVPRF